MSRNDGAWSLTAVQLAGSTNRKVVFHRERIMSEAESRDMLTAVNGFGLWSREDFAWNRGVDDGALWLIEGRRGGAYHPVLLINADSDAMERLAAAFLRMASLSPNMPLEGVEVAPPFERGTQ